MRKLTLARRLSLIVMGGLVVMSAVIMAVVFSITRRTMVAETESRYEGIVMLTNEKIRGGDVGRVRSGREQPERDRKGH